MRIMVFWGRVDGKHAQSLSCFFKIRLSKLLLSEMSKYQSCYAMQKPEMT